MASSGYHLASKTWGCSTFCTRRREDGPQFRASFPATTAAGFPAAQASPPNRCSKQNSLQLRGASGSLADRVQPDPAAPGANGTTSILWHMEPYRTSQSRRQEA